MMNGILHKNGVDWTVAYTYSKSNEPILVTVQWKILTARRTGPFAPILSEGLTVMSEQYDSWQAYAQGDYLILTSEHDGVASEAPYPPPKGNKRVEHRYASGRWEKNLSTKGWVPA